VFHRHLRSSDLSAGVKLSGSCSVLLIPLIGVLVYLIARGGKMHERAARQAQQQDDALRKYLQDEVAAPTSTADQLTKLADLHDRGAITDQEYEQQKAKVLA